MNADVRSTECYKLVMLKRKGTIIKKTTLNWTKFLLLMFELFDCKVCANFLALVLRGFPIDPRAVGLLRLGALSSNPARRRGKEQGGWGTGLQTADDQRYEDLWDVPTSCRLNVVVRSPLLYPRGGPKWRDNYSEGPDHSVVPNCLESSFRVALHWPIAVERRLFSTHSPLLVSLFSSFYLVAAMSTLTPPPPLLAQQIPYIPAPFAPEKLGEPQSNEAAARNGSTPPALGFLGLLSGPCFSGVSWVQDSVLLLAPLNCSRSFLSLRLSWPSPLKHGGPRKRSWLWGIGGWHAPKRIALRLIASLMLKRYGERLQSSPGPKPRPSRPPAITFPPAQTPVLLSTSLTLLLTRRVLPATQNFLTPNTAL